MTKTKTVTKTKTLSRHLKTKIKVQNEIQNVLPRTAMTKLYEYVMKMKCSENATKNNL